VVLLEVTTDDGMFWMDTAGFLVVRLHMYLRCGRINARCLMNLAFLSEAEEDRFVNYVRIGTG